MQLFYNPNIDETTETFYFDKEESKHIIKVLRKKDRYHKGITQKRQRYFICDQWVRLFV